jgi:hypothetical protein
MQSPVQLSPCKQGLIVKAYRNELFPKIFAVHGEETFESLVFVLEFDEDSHLAFVEVVKPVQNDSELLALLADLLFDSFLELVEVSNADEDDDALEADVVS